MQLGRSTSPPLPHRDAEPEPRRFARWAALFYVCLAALGGFAHFFVRGGVYEPGDAAATTANLVANVDLVRIGVVADLFGAASYLFLGFALHRLLRHHGRDMANVMVTLVAIGAGITCLNMVFQIAATLIATEPAYLNAFDQRAIEAFTLLAFDLQYYGYIIVQVFTGLWLVPFGWLALRSNGFPTPLCWGIMVGSLSYLTDLVLHVLAPDVGRSLSEAVLAPVAIAEMWMIGYLVVRGIGRNFIPASPEHYSQRTAQS